MTWERYLCIGGTGSGHDVPQYARGARCLKPGLVPVPNAQGEGRLAVGCLPPLSDQWASTRPSMVFNVTHIHLRTSFSGEEAENGERRGCTRGHSAVLGIPVPKDSVSPIQALKMGIPSKSPGSYESRLQAGETENPKAQAPRPGWRPKETGGGGSRTD